MVAKHEIGVKNRPASVPRDFGLLGNVVRACYALSVRVHKDVVFFIAR